MQVSNGTSSVIIGITTLIATVCLASCSTENVIKTVEVIVTATSESPTQIGPMTTSADMATPTQNASPTPAQSIETLDDLADILHLIKMDHERMPKPPDISGLERGEFETEEEFMRRKHSHLDEWREIALPYYYKLRENPVIWEAPIEIPEYDIGSQWFRIVHRLYVTDQSGGLPLLNQDKINYWIPRSFETGMVTRRGSSSLIKDEKSGDLYFNVALMVEEPVSEAKSIREITDEFGAFLRFSTRMDFIFSDPLPDDYYEYPFECVWKSFKSCSLYLSSEIVLTKIELVSGGKTLYIWKMTADFLSGFDWIN